MRLLFLFVLCLPSWSRADALGEYLGLTPLQIARLERIQADQASRRYAALQRRSQVRSEISEEIKKDEPDPSALGVRYREMELICRELDLAAVKDREEAAAVLLPEQKAKVQALAEVVRLLPVAEQAQAYSLVAPDGYITFLHANMPGGAFLYLNDVEYDDRCRKVPKALAGQFTPLGRP